MATPVKQHSRRPRRVLLKLVRTVASHWALLLASHSAGVALLMLAEQFGRVAACGGR
jgi:hypothetical protein